MLNSYFDQVYVINLDSRPDRLSETDQEFKKIGAHFTKVTAIDGNAEKLVVKPYPSMDERYWNAGALGLVKTTAKIIRHAKEHGYNYILICEDDVEFPEDFNDKVICLEEVPYSWQMILFGAQHIVPPKRITKNIGLVRYGFCLHCYAVKSDIFDYYLHLLEKEEKQLDFITVEDIQPLDKTYCFMPNIAYQRASYSNIQGTDVYHGFLKSRKISW
jgi:GR25 family glycosyltransferase involved in LPS biosynthesis